jgi:sugar/nucleoside kinase (ribokinase family)
MTEAKFDIVAIGNAIVDILALKDRKFLERHKLAHGVMTLTDEKTSEKLYKEMGAATECSGGSAANTAVGFAMLGGRAAFIGKVASDGLGEVFRKDMKAEQVFFDTPAIVKGIETARCLIFVTKENGEFGGPEKAERTMATYLGACTKLTEADMDEELIKASKITYVEGYLWDELPAINAIKKAIRIAKKAGREVAFTLSDPFCVDRHRDAFLTLLKNEIDILFANEHELSSLFQDKDISRCIERLKTETGVKTAAITQSDKGSYILSDGNLVRINAIRLDDVYDVTGAGDLYASGFLYGYVNGYGPEKSGKLATLTATEVIKYLGGRPLSKLSALLQQL